MPIRTALIIALLAELPRIGLAQTAVSQVEAAAYASQAATATPELKAAHTLASQAIDGGAPIPVPVTGNGLKAAPSLELAKAGPKNAKGALSELVDDNTDTIQRGASFAVLGAAGLFVPLIGQIAGGLLAVLAVCGFIFQQQAGADFTGSDWKELALFIGAAAIGVTAVVAPSLGAPAILAGGAAMALYGLGKVVAGLFQ